MVNDLALACGCGRLRGRLRFAPADGRRVVCYCRDCQAFARWLGREAVLLDPDGGTELWQTSPAALVLEAGADALACVRLTRRGLMRWYAGCCATPLANTLASRRLPFVGLPTVVLEERARARLPASRRGVFARSARGPTAPAGAARGAPLTMAVAITADLVRWRRRGDHLRSPFFMGDGAPVAPPQVLSAPERAALERVAG